MKELIREHLNNFVKSLLKEDDDKYTVCDQFKGNKEKSSHLRPHV